MLCIWEVLFASKKQNSLLRCALAQQSLLFLLVLGYTTYLNNKKDVLSRPSVWSWTSLPERDVGWSTLMQSIKNSTRRRTIGVDWLVITNPQLPDIPKHSLDRCRIVYLVDNLSFCDVNVTYSPLYKYPDVFFVQGVSTSFVLRKIS